jgi:hypothetical protein
LQVVVGSFYVILRLIGVATRTMSNESSRYIAGTHSMAFVTVPDEELAKKLAKYVYRFPYYCIYM